MSLYYLPILIRSDRYFITRLEQVPAVPGELHYNFVVPADDRVLTPLITLENPERTIMNQMAPDGGQDIPLSECHFSLSGNSSGYELLIRKSQEFRVDSYQDELGVRLDYSGDQRRICLGFYRSKVEMNEVNIQIILQAGETQVCLAQFQFGIVPTRRCHRTVIDFGSEASQVGYKNCGPQSAILHYDILENLMSRLNSARSHQLQRDEFLNHEAGQPFLYRSFYALKKNISRSERENFPFNFTDDLENDEVRLFITRKEVAATENYFRDHFEIIPNLKLGIERSIQLSIGRDTEDYSIRYHKKDLISSVLLRLLRLMIRTKPGFQHGGLIVTLLVPNIYTQHDVFELLNELRKRTPALLNSLHIPLSRLFIEYETISESDAAFLGYQHTQSMDVQLGNGDMALVIDSGKGTTDISIVMADDNENYSSFFRAGFAGAGNVLLYGFAEDFLTLALRAIPGNNNISIRDFIQRQLLEQNLTAEVLNFIQLMEDQKKSFRKNPVIGITEFAKITEQAMNTERSIANLHKDHSTVLQYAETILKDRNIRWDESITGLIEKASDCIVYCLLASIKHVLKSDIKKRIRVVMLSGRAFYFDQLRMKTEEALKKLLGYHISIYSVPPGRSLNNKNIAIYGAFTGAYKITDFTGIPIDREKGLSGNKDVLNNNLFLYRGLKIAPGNDILYNASVVRRNHQELKAFKHKTLDIYFTRDNIYLRSMENQEVKDVRSLYSVLSSVADVYSPVQDMKLISMFPACSELASIAAVHEDLSGEKPMAGKLKSRRMAALLRLFQF